MSEPWHHPRKKSASNTGFTLIELIIVITLAGIVGVMVSTIVGNQMFGYVQAEERAQLVQMADIALHKMAQDIQNSVPNSVRVSGNFIEMVPILNAAPYRSAPSAAPGSDALNFSAPDQSFHILDDMVSTNTTYNDGQIVIYNLGLEAGGVPVLGSNLFASNPSTLPHVISPAGLTVSNNGNEDLVTLDTPHQFAQSSPDQRFYLVRGALTYHCNPAAGTLQRYQGYSIQQNQPTSAASAPLASAASALLANRVVACGFSYSQGSLSRNSVISLRLTMSDGDQSFSLLRQVQVSNVP